MVNQPMVSGWLPADIPPGLLLAAVAPLLAAWVRSHVRTRGLPRRWRLPAAVGRTLLGTLTLAAAAAGLRPWITLATDWSLAALLALGAAAVEGVLALYRLERGAVRRRTGLTLALLRAALALAVLAMLFQPVLVRETAREFRRQLVVLLDESDSMRVPDDNLTPGEKVRLAEALALPAPARAGRLERTARSLQQAHASAQAQMDWLSALGAGESEPIGRQLSQRRGALQDMLKRALAAVDDGTNALARAAAQPAMGKDAEGRAQLAALAGRLSAGVRPALTNLAERSRRWRRAPTNGVEESRAALAALQAAAAALGELDAPVREAGERADDAFYAACSGAERAAFDRVAALPRLDVARALLLGVPPSPAAGTSAPPAVVAAPESLLARLDRTYGVRLFTVGARPVERTLKDAAPGAPVRAPADADSAQRRRTDLTAALEHVGATLKPEETAGILLLTDGRHNGAAPVEPVARGLGLAPVPVYPVPFGDHRKPPTDAAIVAVAAPDSVSTNDRVPFEVDVKADGMEGSNVVVRLFDGARLAATNAFTPRGDRFRTRVSLSDRPRTNALHEYRLAVDPRPGEVDAGNNERRIAVLVNDDPVKVLLIDGFPRWEFRYLKNLFLERDQHVRLQYLLFHPDGIAGATNRPPIPASVRRPADEIEAGALPAGEAEWMKFDVILLGDVAPAELGPGSLDILNRYVLNRGGALVVIAGARHMPHAFAGTPLEELLPVSFTPSAQPILAAPEPAFRIALTAAGRAAGFMKLADDEARNLKLWNDVPELYWRHGRVAAKVGASVLACAAPADEAARAEQAGFVPDVAALREQPERERAQALIVVHHAGFGNVLFLATDQLWRLRYREGDARHHKFWGQILRWAAADRLSAGTSTVRLGADRPRYAPDEPVRIRARVATPDFAPVVDATLRVTVWSGAQRVVRRALAYVPESPGVYSAELGALPVGRYRVEMDPRDARGLPIALTEGVTAEFAVAEAAASESVELAADRGLLDRVASLSTGALLDPLELGAVTDRLGPARVRREERRQIDLWNSWPWLLAVVALFTAEWLLRRKARLP